MQKDISTVEKVVELCHISFSVSGMKEESYLTTLRSGRYRSIEPVKDLKHLFINKNSLFVPSVVVDKCYCSIWYIAGEKERAMGILAAAVEEHFGSKIRKLQEEKERISQFANQITGGQGWTM